MRFWIDQGGYEYNVVLIAVALGVALAGPVYTFHRLWVIVSVVDCHGNNVVGRNHRSHLNGFVCVLGNENADALFRSQDVPEEHAVILGVNSVCYRKYHFRL